MQSFNPTAVPKHDLERLGDSGHWRSVGSDPQFALLLNEGREISAGWLEINVHIDFRESHRRSRLYWDDGSGFDEQHSLLLPIPRDGVARCYRYFPKPLNGLRLDPCDCEAEFFFGGVRLRSRGMLGLALGAMRPYARRAIQNPRLYAAVAADVGRLVLRRGPGAVRGALRELALTQNGGAVRAYITSQLRAPLPRAGRGKSGSAVLGGGRLFSSRSRATLRIGIGLVEHVGDIVACEPVVRYLRKRHPDAEISWVVRDTYRELIDNNPNIDHTIAVDCLTDWMKWTAHGAFDQIVDLHVNERICQHCRIPLRKSVGDTSISGDNHFNHGSLLQAFSRSAGLPPLDDAPVVYIPEAAVRVVDSLGLPDNFIVFHCQSNSLEKDWEAARWADLARWVKENTRYKVVEVGLQPVLSDSGLGAIDLTGRTTLLEMAEILRRSRLFVGVDSGPAHFANALKVPGVILLGQLARFRSYNPFSGDYGAGRNVWLARNEVGPAATLPFEEVRSALEQGLNAGIGDSVEHMQVTARALAPVKASGHDMKPKVIAFYLPQYHPIPENDHAWGRGFTEWRNVGKSIPYFDGQYQPRLPGELGYYDLRVPEVMEHQAELALANGVDAFCYYYYWFNGRRLLHLPIDNMLRRRKPAMPFCFCWANENWTRRWDGHEKEIIVGQDHNPKDDIDFIRFIMPALEDPRYLRVNGKPLLLVYRTELFPDPVATAERWRNETIRAGIGDLYLVRCEGFDPWTTPDSIGFDAAYEVPTFILPDELKVTELKALHPRTEWQGRVYDYQRIVDYYLSRERPSYKRYHGPMLAWDNTPRHGNRAVVFHGVTDERFERWVTGALRQTRRDFVGEERLLFVNAWNEWAEGSYLEPDLRYGSQFLKALRRAVDLNDSSTTINDGQGTQRVDHSAVAA